ncbi:hypothetical protein [Nocardioides sp. SYSU DS0663]|uniref:hypothetical protein n=1 Tax=Nocardioides sp. SYSU DS0663 TaxID=3416445 RepID=UPI003F4B5219
MDRLAGLAAGLVAVPLLGACSEEPEQTGPPPTSWSPCSDLEPEEVSALLGEEVTEETGATGVERCTYVPVAEGGPTLDLNYLWFDGPFEEAWDTIGDVAGRVQDLEVPTADGARMVVQTTDEAVVVTAFVQTGGLVESVNGISLDTDDRGRLVRAARGVIRLLSARAPESR